MPLFEMRTSELTRFPLGFEGSASDHPHPSFPFSAMGVFEHPLRRKSPYDGLLSPADRDCCGTQSIQSVALWQFFLATFVVFPKIAIFVFVGSRLADLSDGETRSHMDTSKSFVFSATNSSSLHTPASTVTKILNISISVGGVIIAAVASW